MKVTKDYRTITFSRRNLERKKDAPRGVDSIGMGKAASATETWIFDKHLHL